MSSEQIEALIAERLAAKKRRDFKRSDEIRQQLADSGILVEDTKDGRSAGSTNEHRPAKRSNPHLHRGLRVTVRTCLPRSSDFPVFQRHANL